MRTGPGTWIEAEGTKWAPLAGRLPETAAEMAGEVVAALSRDGYAYIQAPVSIENHDILAAQIGQVMSRSDVKVDKERGILQEKTRVVKGRPGPYGSDVVGFHTDNIRVDVMSMYCIEQDSTNGAILLLDTDDLTECFSASELTDLTNIELWAPPVTPPGEPKEDFYYRAPLLSKGIEGYRVYYIPWLLPESLNDASKDTLRKFADYVKRKEETRMIDLPVKKQESVFINNHRMLHGRRAIPGDSKRHMVRHYISVPAMSCRSLIRKLEPEVAGEA